MKKLLISLTCFVIILSCFGTTVFAAVDSGILPRANNVANTSTDFYIENGSAFVKVGYSGLEGITTNAVITTKLQKQFLFFFWQDVDGGSWTDYADGTYYSNLHSISVSSGTYRVQVEYVIYGSGGAADVITDEIEAKN